MKYLHRHPSEVDLTLEQIWEVAVIAQDLEKHEIAVIKATRGIF